MACKFCEGLEMWKSINQRNKDFAYEYKTAIVIRSWFKEHGKRSASRITDYRWRGIGYKLNYCPECGRKLKTSKNY